MSYEPTSGVREAVGFFESETALQETIDDLLSHGFDRAEISVLASVEAIEEKLNSFFDKVSTLEDDPKVPHVAYVAKEDIGNAEGAVIGGLMYVGALIGIIPVVISGGALAAVLMAGAIGGGVGTAIGAIFAGLIGQHHSEYISEQLQHGGLLLWVRTFTVEDEKRAIDILSKHSGKDVHIHGLPDVQTELEDTYLGALQNAQDQLYEGALIIRADTGAYYTSGKIFSTESEAKSYVDRVQYVNDLHARSKHSDIDLRVAMVDPADIFETPKELVNCDLNIQDKIELLRRWAYNEKELEMASDDGMVADAKGDHLQEIEKEIIALEAI